MIRKGKGIAPLAVGLAVVVAAACSRPLPEEGTAAAELYRTRCGGCHRPVNPASMKYPAWEMVLPRMEARIHESEQGPLSESERQTIDSYLKRNAG